MFHLKSAWAAFLGHGRFARRSAMGLSFASVLLLLPACLPAQHSGSADLSEAEVETIREAAMDPAARVVAFQKIVDTRIDRIQRVLLDMHAQGRAADLHQNIDEVSGIVNELEDNLDEYTAAHKDLRKVLPKLSASADRWASILRQPPGNDRYNVTRKLALEVVADVKEDAAKLLAEQQAYFKEHPSVKEPPSTRYEVPR